ncbi:DUF1120 domain-containing protein [Chromobacterium rhizoryzae]|uniref:DUF1120 domain-containing protein n=2 Tax=Chromobacteriaceae TaxID=1499392 RepID=A0AAD0RUV8_9NEIS|nr:DUF1120 domain-containing protein [Chromobacterium sp. IRSSSOUMB001]AXT48875.1 DUF1120 domain-containing protein [Chromobacterium rhizoryzae]
MFSGASQLAAANSADLFIKGRLVPPACTPALDGGATIDYGDIPVSNLKNNAAYTLEDHNVSLTVTCEKDTALGIRITDARSESKPTLLTEIPMPAIHSSGHAVATADTQTMGLGSDGAKGKLGVWWMSMEFDKLNATNSEGIKVNDKALLFSADNGQNWANTTTTPMAPHFGGANLTTFAIKATSGFTPAVATVHTFPLVVGAALNTKGGLSVKDDTKLDGKGTFTIYYQ